LDALVWQRRNSGSLRKAGIQLIHWMPELFFWLNLCT
jgi:hypothetical protein